MSGVHRTAARGFEAVAGSYDAARPGYPDDAVDAMLDAMSVGRGSTVCDLGAGTGKFTRALVERGVTAVPVEPLAGMRAELARLVPGVTPLDGTAEQIPLADASMDGFTAAQAFHWFATAAAVDEITRVLRPGAALGLIWNARDDATDWVARVTAIFARYEGADGVRIPRHRERVWRGVVEASSFEPVAAQEFPNAQMLTPEGLVRRLGSVSFIAVLPEEERARAYGEIRSLIETHPDLRGRDEIVHPYVTEVYVYRKP